MRDRDGEIESLRRELKQKKKSLATYEAILTQVPIPFPPPFSPFFLLAFFNFIYYLICLAYITSCVPPSQSPAPCPFPSIPRLDPDPFSAQASPEPLPPPLPAAPAPPSVLKLYVCLPDGSWSVLTGVDPHCTVRYRTL